MALIAAIDQGTTSTRVCITRTDGKVVAQSQFEHAQHMPQKGWVEHDPMEIWRNTRRALSEALADEDISEQDIDALGLTNQRETAVIWEKKTASRSTTPSCGRTPARTTTATPRSICARRACSTTRIRRPRSCLLYTSDAADE